MNFIVSSSALHKQLQQISGVVSNNTVLPILEDFLFVIEKGKLNLFSTDLEISMISGLEIEAKDNGKVAIPAKMLMNILNALPDQPLTFSIDEKTFGIELKASNGKYRVSGENGDDFPRTPVAEDIKDIKLASSVLKNAITACLFAVGTDEMRPAMTGINFELSNQGLTFIATDAHKLVRFKRHDAKTSKSASFIIPRKALLLLNSTLPADDTQVTISYNSSNAFFAFNNISLICRLIDARYPDYNAVIPKDNNNHLTINRNELMGMLRRLIIFANKTTNQITFKLSGSELNGTARDPEFGSEGSETLACSYSGENLEIAFNGKFLIEMLSSTSSEEVSFAFSTSNRAVLVSPLTQDGNEDLLMLVMPIMVN